MPQISFFKMTIRASATVTAVFAYACPACHLPLGANLAPPCTCDVTWRPLAAKARPLLQMMASASRSQMHTEQAYRLYSLFYAPISLLAYWLVWRGHLLRHIAFFRELLAVSPDIVDVATGDGSLTRLALLGRRRVRNLLCIDISAAMLRRATRKLAGPGITLVRGDVERLPLVSASVAAVSCFGGVNSFPSMTTAFRELARVLAPDGVIRGSALLSPEASWRQRLIKSWIRKGYQTVVIDPRGLAEAITGAGLKMRRSERHGDVLLYELVRELERPSGSET